MEIYNKKITPTERSRGDLMLPMTKKHNSIWNDFLSKAGLAVALDMGTTKTWDVELRFQGAQSCTVQVVHHTRKMIKLPKTFMQDNNVTVGSKLSIACVLSETSPLSGWLELSVAAPDRSGSGSGPTAAVIATPAPAAAVLAPAPARAPAAAVPATAPGAAIVAAMGVVTTEGTAAPTAAVAAALLPDSRSKVSKARKRAQRPVKAGAKRTAPPAEEPEVQRPQRKRSAPKAFMDYEVHSADDVDATFSSQQKKVRVERALVPAPSAAPAAPMPATAAAIETLNELLRILGVERSPIPAPAPAVDATAGSAAIAAPITAVAVALDAARGPLPSCRKRNRDDTNELCEDISAMQPRLKGHRTVSPEAAAEGAVAEQGAKLLSPETPDFDEDMDAIAELMLSMARSNPSVDPVPMEEDDAVPVVENMPAIRRQRAGGLRRQPRPSRRLLE